MRPLQNEIHVLNNEAFAGLLGNRLDRGSGQNPRLVRWSMASLKWCASSADLIGPSNFDGFGSQ